MLASDPRPGGMVLIGIITGTPYEIKMAHIFPYTY